MTRSLRMGVADMNDDDSNWMSLDEATTYVEATVKCYREKAIDLVRQAADGLKLKSRTTVNSPPRWVDLIIDGKVVTVSDRGIRLEICRKDVLELWPEQKKDAAASTPSRIGSGAIADGIRLAIADLWPDGIPEGLRAKDRDIKILDWLIAHKKSVPEGNGGLSKAVQRVLKQARDASKAYAPA